MHSAFGARPPETRNGSVGCAGRTLFAGELDGEGPVGLRPGTLDPMPNVEARWHIWVSSMPSWDVLSDDGLPKYEQGVTG